jgi:hypothetical protein
MRVLTVEDWAEIRRLYRVEKMPVKAIARAMGVAEHGAGGDRQRGAADV